MALSRRVVAEALGTAFLLAAVVGSGRSRRDCSFSLACALASF
jgi:glycerol uptake facilitator-like aquaporin